MRVVENSRVACSKATQSRKEQRHLHFREISQNQRPKSGSNRSAIRQDNGALAYPDSEVQAHCPYALPCLVPFKA